MFGKSRGKLVFFIIFAFLVSLKESLWLAGV